jgi:hypothetical protein
MRAVAMPREKRSSPPLPAKDALKNRINSRFTARYGLIGPTGPEPR